MTKRETLETDGDCDPGRVVNRARPSLQFEVVSTSEKPSADPRCIQAACGRSLARPSKFCPYCGGPTSALDEDAPTESAQEELSGDAPPEIVPAPAVPPGAAAPLPQDPPVSVESAAMPAATAASAAAPAVVQPTPRRIHPILIAVGATAALALLLLLLRPSPKAVATDLQATAEADRWTTLDLSGFELGAHIAMTADGPFRIRSATDSPRLVSGNGTIDLGEIHRDGIEVKSASGRRIEVKIEVLAQ